MIPARLGPLNPGAINREIDHDKDPCRIGAACLVHAHNDRPAPSRRRDLPAVVRAIYRLPGRCHQLRLHLLSAMHGDGPRGRRLLRAESLVFAIRTGRARYWRKSVALKTASGPLRGAVELAPLTSCPKLYDAGTQRTITS